MKLDIKEYEEKMKKTVGVYKTDLDGVRVGRANTAVLQKVFVDYYGSPTPINNVAEVKVTDARTIVIQPWDSKMLKEIGKVIQASDIGITPIDDGKGNSSQFSSAYRGTPSGCDKADRKDG